jgi:hypothetical protein
MDLSPLSPPLPAWRRPGKARRLGCSTEIVGIKHVAWDGTGKSRLHLVSDKASGHGARRWDVVEALAVPQGQRPVSWLHHCMPDFPRIFLIHIVRGSWLLLLTPGLLGDD